MISSTLPPTAGSTNGMPMESVPPPVGGNAKRKLEQRLLASVIVLLLAALPTIVYETAVPPMRMGFFCHDNTIRLPFLRDTVSPIMLLILSVILPVVVICAVELVRHRAGAHVRGSIRVFGIRVAVWLAEAVQNSWQFLICAAFTLGATEVGKFTIGRLRPHFIDVCQPRLLDGTNCMDLQNYNRYIEDYECTIGAGFSVSDVRQARLSFPSGHTSLTFNAMVYLALYMQVRFTWRKAYLARALLQFVLLSVAWFTALSRVKDNMHHWGDVLVGAALGIVIPVIYLLHVLRFFSYRPSLRDSYSMGGTPPPFAKTESKEILDVA